MRSVILTAHSSDGSAGRDGSDDDDDEIVG